MRGPVVNLFGGNVYGPDLRNAESFGELHTPMTIPEACFWFWGVAQISVDWNFIRGSDGVVNSGFTAFGKFYVDDESFVQAVDSELQLVDTNAPSFDSQLAGIPNIAIRWFFCRMFPTTDNKLLTTFALVLQGIGGSPTIFTSPIGPFSAGTINFSAYDAVKDKTYSFSLPAFTDIDATVTGTCNITATGFYPYRDPATNTPLYNTTTGNYA